MSESTPQNNIKAMIVSIRKEARANLDRTEVICNEVKKLTQEIDDLNRINDKLLALNKGFKAL